MQLSVRPTMPLGGLLYNLIPRYRKRDGFTVNSLTLPINSTHTTASSLSGCKPNAS